MTAVIEPKMNNVIKIISTLKMKSIISAVTMKNKKNSSEVVRTSHPLYGKSENFNFSSVLPIEKFSFNDFPNS